MQTSDSLHFDIDHLIKVLNPHIIKCFKESFSENALNSNSLLSMLSETLTNDDHDDHESNISKMRKTQGTMTTDDDDDDSSMTETNSRIEQVMMYILYGDISMDLMSGKCSKEIIFMGFEHLFDYFKEAYTPFCDKYTTMLRLASPQLWWLTMQNMHERRTLYNRRSTATMAQLRVMDRDSFAMEPLIQLNPKSCWTQLRPPTPQSQVDPSLINHESVTKVIMCSNLPWAGINSNSSGGVILAGGCLESMLLGVAPRDVDIFIVLGMYAAAGAEEEDTPMVLQQGNNLVAATMTAIFEAHQSRNCLIFVKVSTHVTTITVRSRRTSSAPLIVYQVIHRIYASAAQVVAGFDIDSCRLLFDGVNLRAHDTAFRAWRNGWNLFDTHTLSTTAIIRYTKKFFAGLGILVVGMNDNDVASFKSKWSSIFNYVPPETELISTFKTFCGRMLRHSNNRRMMCLDISVPSLILHTSLNNLLATYVNVETNMSDYGSWEMMDDVFIEHNFQQLYSIKRLFPKFSSVSCTMMPQHLYNVRRHKNNIKLIMLQLSGAEVRLDKLFTGSFNPVTVQNVYRETPELTIFLTKLANIVDTLNRARNARAQALMMYD